MALPASNWILFDESKRTNWTAEENKRFENALALFDKDTPDRWQNVAAMIPGKTVNDVLRQYRELVEDVSDIEAGLIPVPGYVGSSFTLEWVGEQEGEEYEGLRKIYGGGGKRSRSCEHERKKGVPWTEDEHRQFLLGLKKYGKGDWRNISRNFVISRTPTQVASHAQKYFIRQLSGGKDKRRSSIHDITTVTPAETKSPSPDNLSTKRFNTSNIDQHLHPTIIHSMAVSQAFYEQNQPQNGAVSKPIMFNVPNNNMDMVMIPYQQEQHADDSRWRGLQLGRLQHSFP